MPSEQIPVPSVPLMLFTRLITALEVTEQGSICWCRCARWNVAETRGRQCGAEQRCQVWWSSTTPLPSSLLQLRALCHLRRAGKFLLGHQQRTGRICPNLLLPSCPAALRKTCTWNGGLCMIGSSQGSQAGKTKGKNLQANPTECYQRLVRAGSS